VTREYIKRTKATIGKYKSDVARLMDEDFWGYASSQAFQVAFSFKMIANDMHGCSIDELKLKSRINRLCIKTSALSDGLKGNSNPDDGMKLETESVNVVYEFRKEIDELIEFMEKVL